MLFNSYEFILGFLPLALAGFFLLGAVSRTLALRWVIAVSLIFYAWWRPLNVLIIAPSILVNFVLARLLQRFGREERRSASTAALLFGIAFNVAFLGYFKYANFAVGATNDVFGTRFVIEHVVLPLGISFITFQKIAFLIDVHARRVESFTLQEYCLFVLFFPQLVAGPIVHFREVMPQFQRTRCRFDREDVAVGLTLFVFGLGKKVLLADGIAPSVSAIYEHAAAGGTVGFVAGWMAAAGFTLQIYFDFSGYTDMALGLARFFGVSLPPNFDSPLKATSIIEFWQRWHMTLTRFLTAYIYNPLALALTRRRMARGRPALGGRTATIGAFIQLLMLPTLLTMLISGTWHGAGYLYIVWGLLHGVYLSINHGWRLVASRLWRDKAAYARFMEPAGFLLTLACVMVSMVVFRSPTAKAAGGVFKGMFGMNGIDVPTSIRDRLGPLARWFASPDVADALAGQLAYGQMILWIGGLALVALAFPNTLEFLQRYEPALGWKPRPRAAGPIRGFFAWEPSLGWACLISALAAGAILHVGGQSEFLYWQF